MSLFNPTKSREFTLIFYSLRNPKELEDWINSTINLKRTTEVKTLKPVRGINLSKSGYFLTGSPETGTIYAVTGELGDPIYISGLVRYGWEDLSPAEYAFAKNALLGHPDTIGWIDQAVPDAKIVEFLLSEGIIESKKTAILQPGPSPEPTVPIIAPKPIVSPVNPDIPPNPVDPVEPGGIEGVPVKTGSLGIDPMLLLIPGLLIAFLIFLKR